MADSRVVHVLPATTSDSPWIGPDRAGSGQIAAELFISRKAVDYHLGNIYAKCGLSGRQELGRFVGQQRQPTAA